MNRILTIPAAEYVPTIPEAWKIIDLALKSTTAGDDLLNERDCWKAAFDGCKIRISDLEAQLAEARKDTERLNWLDDNPRAISVHGAGNACTWTYEEGKNSWGGKRFVLASLREAIHSAISQTKSKQEGK